MDASLTRSTADQILEMHDDHQVHRMVGDLAKTRRLAQFMCQLNHEVLDGDQVRRSKAIAVLTRMGFWQD